MNKKVAILIVVFIEVLVYSFLFIGLPALEDFVVCPTCNAMELPSARPFLYCFPGAIGILLLLGIWKQKKEVKKGE